MLKFLVGLLLLAGCGNKERLPIDVYNSPEASREVPTTEKLVGRADNLSVAKKRAHDLLQRAARNTRSPEEREMFRRVDTALAQSRVAVPAPGRDLQPCVQERDVLAFVNLLVPNVIQVCARAAAADARHLSQVLIHEAAHVAGVHDECAATKVEVGTIRRAGERIAFRNGYMQRCGLR